MIKSAIEAIETQVALARWHLAAMENAGFDAKSKHREWVAQLCEELEASTCRAGVPPAVRAEIKSKVAVLRACLELPAGPRERAGRAARKSKQAKLSTRR